MSDSDKMKPLKVLPGIDENLELHNDRLIIRKQGFLPRYIPGFPGAHRMIYPSEMNDVTMRSDHGSYRGTLQLILKEQDDLAIVFGLQHQELAEEIQANISDMVKEAQGFPG